MNPQPKKNKSMRREVEIDRDVYVVGGAVPKVGMKLTRERIEANFRFLNGGTAANAPPRVGRILDRNRTGQLHPHGPTG